MKKKFVLLACAIAAIACLCLAACSSSEYVGTWKADKASYLGIEVSMDQIYADGCSITLESNGNAKMVAGSETGTGTWEETNNGFTLKESDGSTEQFTKVDSKTISVSESGATITFVKS